MSKQRVLFLCTGNSARSQMAEGLVRHYLGDRWQAFSAGTRPAGTVHPLAVQVMAEWGIDISGHVSKPVGQFQGLGFALVVTVCDDAARNCPLWLGRGTLVHVGFPDPAAATGSEAERREAFRRVRDDLKERVLALLSEFPARQGRRAFDVATEL
ncbi:MAG: arsenate reductase ArsC [Chloroflexia bacterium]|nr:arsenate reductase ArsC [Chloroflexia bacterium]